MKKNKIEEREGWLSRLWGRVRMRVSDWCYDLSVRIHQKTRRKKEKRRTLRHSARAQSRFLFCVLVYPVTVFIIFYLVVNVRSILFAFQQYEWGVGGQSGGFVWNQDPLGNFKDFLNALATDQRLLFATKNSLILYALGLAMMPLQIICSFLVYKKIPLANTFKVFLFLPSIISSIVMVIVYRYFINFGLPELLVQFGITENPRLFDNVETVFPVVVVYNLWLSLGTNIILYTGVMARISDSLVESGKLDGMSMWEELWYITIPLIFPTITVFMVTGVAGIFTNQANLYAFFGKNASANAYTFGYYLFIMVANEAPISEYPFASAAGLLFTAVAVPITLLVKYVLEKFGPNAEY